MKKILSLCFMILAATGCSSDSGTTATSGTVTTGTTAFTVINNGMTSYTINNTANPTLTLQRGQTYTFTVSSSGHPFHIKTVQGTGTTNDYTTGMTGTNGLSTGTLTFAVPAGAPNTLYYNCEFHASMTGVITITN